MKILIYGVWIFIVSVVAIAQNNIVTPVDKIIAIVNREVITQSTLARKKVSLEQLIDTVLLSQLAKRSSIIVSEEEVNKAIAHIAKENKMELGQLKKVLQEQEGLSFQEYRKQIQNEMVVARVKQQFLGRDIVISNAEVAVVLRNPPKADNKLLQYHVVDLLFESEQAAIKFRAKLIAKDNLADVVRNYNATAAQKVIFNDLGWRRIDDLPVLFAQKISTMQAGQVTAPLQAPNGFHIIQLLETDAGKIKLSPEDAKNIVYQQKMAASLKVLLKELRANAYIKINK